MQCLMESREVNGRIVTVNALYGEGYLRLTVTHSSHSYLVFSDKSNRKRRSSTPDYTKAKVTRGNYPS